MVLIDSGVWKILGIDNRDFFQKRDNEDSGKVGVEDRCIVDVDAWFVLGESVLDCFLMRDEVGGIKIIIFVYTLV